MTELDQSSFNDWKDHPVTKRLFEILQDNVTEINERMLNPQTIFDKNSDKILAECLGEKIAFNRILEMQVSDLIEEEVNNDNEEAFIPIW